MSAPNRKKTRGGRNRFNCTDNKNNFRNQDNSLNYSGERKRLALSDLSIYTIARFLMGNEVQIVTNHDRFEGVLRTFDSTTLGLSKVFVFDNGFNENIPIMKNLCELKEVLMKDILLIKMLNGNGKLESVIIDQEIIQRKQISKPNLNEDKNLVPYFDEDESQIHSNDDEDDLNTTLKADQNCWYHPEDMLKVNEERFNLKKTYSETMDEYSTPIDKNDPLLNEKIERAERLAKEIENENNLKRGRLLEDDDGQDEEIMFSAVIPSSALTKPETPVSIPIRLNPNAPEFRPRIKQPDEVSEHVEEVIDNCQSLNIESVQQHQQQQMMHVNRLSLQQFAMGPQMNPQIQAYQGQRIISNQWPIQASSSGQYVIQPYQPVMQQHLLPQRQMQPETIQPGSVFYQFSPQFIIPQEHSLSGVTDGSHLYPSSLDTNNQINHTHSTLHQLRPIQHIPILQTNQMSLHHQQQQQNTQQQQLNAYYQQSPHQQLIGPPINSANFPHLIMNQQQPQLPNGATIQAYITNGRQ